MNRTTPGLAITVGAAALVVAIAATQPPHLHLAGMAPLSADQILAQARPLGALLAPSAAQATVEPADLDPRMPGVSPGKRWEVSWEDGQGTPLASFVYSAGTGELLYASSECSSVAAVSAPLSRLEAQEQSRYWMAYPGVAAQTRAWKLIGTPDRLADGTWRVAWEDGDRAALTLIDPRSGLLRFYVTTAFAGSVHCLLPPAARERWKPGPRQVAR